MSNKIKKQVKKSTATQPIKDKKDVRRLMNYYLFKGNARNYVLIVMGVHTALRISDLLKITWAHVFDFESRTIKNSFTLVEQKTGKAATISLHANVIKALKKLAREVYPACAKQFVFENRCTQDAIGRIQAYRIIREAAEGIGLTQPVSCHSLRKTFGYHIWKMGISPVLIMDIFNHTSIKVTMRYLGISQDDKNEVYLALVM